MKNIIKTLILSMAAGLFIGIGGTVSLMQTDKFVGAFLFTVGLLTILIFGFNLYTGMVGYITKNFREKKWSYFFTVLLVWAGNFLGTAMCAGLIRLTGLYAVISKKVGDSVSAKLDNTWYSLLILGFFCGALMYIAVDTFKANAGKRDLLGIVAVFMGVMVFILAGFEHSIADMFYFVLSGRIADSIVPLLIITVGNGLGGNLIPLFLLIKEN